ncbi:MAG: PmbA protein [Bacteriovoracaceae bacterium]|jgi:PmbA protein
MEDYRNIVEDVLKIAKDKGVAADCILNTNSLLSLKSEDQELSEHKVSSSLVLGVRVIKDKRVGTSYSESWDKESLHQMVDAAIGFSKYTKEEPLETIDLSRTDFLEGTIDKVYKEDDSSLEEKINFCLSLESEVKKKDSAVKSTPYNNLSRSESENLYGNSLGTFCGQKTRSFSCFTSALIEKNNQQSMHYHVSVGRKLSELSLSEVVEESYLHANKLLGAGPIETGNYDIIFKTDELADLFSCFSGLLSGHSAMNDTNPWKNKVGEVLAMNEFSLLDDPSFEKGFSYTKFDNEGELTGKTTLIENGKLETFYHNSKTSKFFKVPNTFHAARSARGTLGVSGSNQIILPGSTLESDLKKERYFEVVKMQGLFSGADSVSGNFSFGASGYLKEGDDIITPVAGITISGNFFELLKEIKMMGSTTHSNSSRGFFSPAIRFGGLKIAGK